MDSNWCEFVKTRVRIVKNTLYFFIESTPDFKLRFRRCTAAWTFSISSLFDTSGTEQAVDCCIGRILACQSVSHHVALYVLKISPDGYYYWFLRSGGRGFYWQHTRDLSGSQEQDQHPHELSVTQPRLGRSASGNFHWSTVHFQSFV